MSDAKWYALCALFLAGLFVLYLIAFVSQVLQDQREAEREAAERDEDGLDPE